MLRYRNGLCIMSKKVPQRREYECVGACLSAESNCACAVWRRTLLPSVFRLAVKGVSRTWLGAKTETMAHSQPRGISCQMHCACVCVCMCGCVPFQRRHKKYPCAQVMSQRR